ncbi:unnamed protein product [Rotaria socialis]|uniref:NYN domain-containing protein n=3 Tax=Rotaria socialis TaxID=392032 RepID=A0A820N4H8_9BILA|nr:unnamed protein product [Rotaria socialis]CAF4382684.1 unnamed protein product [Rotaria socialis]
MLLNYHAKVYLFVDWANTYREAKKKHNPNVYRENRDNATPVSEATATTEQSAATHSPDEESATTAATAAAATTTMPNNLFLGAVADFLSKSKKYNYTDQAENYATTGLLTILKSIKSLENYEELEQKLLTSKNRKEFVRIHLANSEKVMDHSQRFVLMPHHLQVICCRCDTYAFPRKDQCYSFVSHRPDRKEEIKKTHMYQRMSKYFTVLFHERITTKQERAARKKQGKQDEEVAIKEKEKGVDVDIGIQITHTIRTAKEKNEHIRIVLVSGDADFKPVIQYAIDSGVPIEVWSWEGSISVVYTAFLKKKEREIGEDIIFYLDYYLYQIGFVTGVMHKWSVKFYKFFRPPPYESTKEERETVDTLFASFSHYTIAARLQLKDSEPDFTTSDFVIHWSARSFTISFAREYLRERFEKFLQETPNDGLVKKLNSLHRIKREYVKQCRKPEEDVRETPAFATKKSKYAVLEASTEDESDSDEEDCFEDGEDETERAIKHDHNDNDNVNFRN